MIVTRITDSATEPVTSTQVEDALVISTGWDSARITLLIQAARQSLEMLTDRSFVTQTWKMYLDEFPDVIYIPKGNLISITELAYDDTDGNEQILVVDTDYTIDNNGKVSRISPVGSFPSTIGTQLGNVRLTYTAGYGAASDVPAAIKEAVIAKVEQLYSGKMDNQNMIDSLIDPYKMFFDYCING